MELCGREEAAELPLFQRLCGLRALSAWSGSALSHLGGVQHQTAITAAGPTPNQDVQALDTHLAEHCRLGSRDGMK